MAIASTVILTGAAGAQTSGPGAPAAAPEPSQKLVCVRSHADTGSHFGGGKVCHTESEWAMIHDQSSRMMERYDTLQNKMPGSAGGR